MLFKNLLLCASLLLLTLGLRAEMPFLLAQAAATAESTEAAPPADTELPPVEDGTAAVENDIVENPFESELVQVDWMEEMMEGGITMVVLAILSVALGAFLIERFLTLRKRNFMPSAFLKKVHPLFIEGRYPEILELCQKNKNTASEIVEHLVEFRGTDFNIISEGAGDIGARAVLDQEEKCNPLSVIAGVAPLLGLLGTMIGMIEAFKLVEVFGDEGGASLLAGSISKALITTAVGLILAIPALLGYHWARRRVHSIGTAIEIETESLLKDWFLHRKK